MILTRLSPQRKDIVISSNVRVGRGCVEMKREEWNKRFQAAQLMPPVGFILTSPKDYVVTIEEDLYRPGDFLAVARYLVSGTYPEEPKGELVRCRKGLKIFLSRQSRLWIDSNYSILVTDFLIDCAQRIQGGVVPSESSYIPSVSFDCDIPIRIIGYAASGKSAHGTFILGDT